MSDVLPTVLQPLERQPDLPSVQDNRHVADRPRPVAVPLNGYYLLHRGWQDHDVFKNEPYSSRDAWVWLIEHALWKDNGDLKRGQLDTSLGRLSRSWKWSIGRVRSFLGRLETSTMISTTSNTRSTRITICNYEKYQAPPQVTRTVESTTSSRHNEEECKEDVCPPYSDYTFVQTSSRATVSRDELDDLDCAKLLFGDRLDQLAALQKKGPEKLKALMGRWASLLRGDHRELLVVVDDAIARCPHKVVGFIERSVVERANGMRARMFL